MEDHVSLATEQRYEFCFDSNFHINGSAFSNSHGLLAVGIEISHSSLDEMMMNVAYGDKLLYSDGGPQDSASCQSGYCSTYDGSALLIAWWFHW